MGAENDIKELVTTKYPFALIDCPVLIIHGKADIDVPIYHAHYANMNIRTSSLSIVKSGSHVLPLCDRRSSITRLKIKFIDKVIKGLDPEKRVIIE